MSNNLVPDFWNTLPDSINRQPKTIDVLHANKFKLTIHRTPYLEYFCQTVDIPGISVPEIVQPSHFTAIKRPGTVVTYGDFNVSFLVSEDLENWLSVYDWMTRTVPTRSFKEVYKENEIYSDITLNVLSNKSNRVMEVLYKQCFPTALSTITLDATSPDAANITATVTFAYSGYTIIHKKDEKELPVA